MDDIIVIRNPSFKDLLDFIEYCGHLTVHTCNSEANDQLAD